MLIDKERILKKVYKPARYLGNEWNAIRVTSKSIHQKVSFTKIALCFPSLYEIGMSHLGFRIIYGLLNEKKDIICERVFMPDGDLEKILRQERIPLFSLESYTPLNKFDVIGFSLSYELLFPNVLNMLELSHIPFMASERNERFPLIIAGGYSCINPEPMADFFDCFIIGEGEEAILKIIDKIKIWKLQNKKNKVELLKELSQIEGVYVPSLYKVEYNQNGTVRSFIPKESFLPLKIKKRIISDLDSAFFPKKWLVPYLKIIHDRVSLEIMRGCPNSCRFCQAKSVYHPYRLRSPEKIIELSKILLKSSGYEEISLLGLSCGDYPRLKEVILELMSFCRDKAISISLPSLKAKNYIEGLPLLLSSLKKTGLTFAPEAGSERLRKFINKDIDIEALFNVIKNAYAAGYRHVKLYFIIGLPGERDEDLDEIIRLALQIVNLRKEIDGKLGRVTLSISAFSPKPHTPFERFPMENIEELERKKAYLLSRVRAHKNIYSKIAFSRAIKINFHNFKVSFIETVLSRGDRRLSRVIYHAFKLGLYNFLEEDKFNFSLWLKAFDKAEIDPHFYATRRISTSEVLPWSHIDTGIRYLDTKEF
jgi:radical SAM family uncharacterized protein